MPHAVLRIPENERLLFDEKRQVRVRPQFYPLLRECRGYEVVLYQSARRRPAEQKQFGYFAIATLTRIDYEVVTGKCLVTLMNIVPLEQTVGLLENGIAYESELLTPDHKLRGWHAARDVREISPSVFEKFSGHRKVAEPQFDALEDHKPVHRLRNRFQNWRDPTFGHRVYHAYRGVCAISGVTLLGPDGYSGLQAAHLFPYALEPHDETSAGILLAPTWHVRIDSGAITLHQNYTWSANIPDSDTDAISSRVLRLPLEKADWPDMTLLRKKKQLLSLV